MLCAALLAATLAAEPSDWPRFMGPAGDGFAAAAGLNADWQGRPPRELWRRPMGDQGHAGPAIAGGILYIVDHARSQDLVLALDAATGAERWRFAYEDTAKQDYGFARATPAIADGRVFAVGRLGQVHALDAATGKLLWKLDLDDDLAGEAPKWAHSASPVVMDGQVIVTPGGKHILVALDPATGKPLWRGDGLDEMANYTTPVASGGAAARQWLTFSATHLVALDARGKLLWKHPWKTGYDINTAMPIVVPDGIFITSGYNHGSALIAIADGKPREVWTNKLMASRMNTPVLVGGWVYGTSQPGYLSCLDPATGKEGWRQKGFAEGGVCAFGDRLVVRDDKSGDVVLVAADPKAYRELGRLKPFAKAGEAWAPPIIGGGLLAVRTKTELAVFDLR